MPVGSDAFWKILQECFQHSDWRVRFQAVERVTVIARFMDSTPLRSEINLQTALATAFCHLIASMDDINVYVAQRATLYLGTIHDTAIRVSNVNLTDKSLQIIQIIFFSHFYSVWNHNLTHLLLIVLLYCNQYINC